MTPASMLLSEVEARGVEVRPHGEHLYLEPVSLLTADLMERLRAAKPEVMALVKVRLALANKARLTAPQIQAATELKYRDLYQALAELFDWYEISSDHNGFYWMVDQKVN